MLKFDASIFGGELPVGLGVVGIWWQTLGPHIGLVGRLWHGLQSLLFNNSRTHGDRSFGLQGTPFKAA